MRTIGAALDATGGVGPGFDRLRLVLATLVIAIHSIVVVAGPGGANNSLWLASELVVPAFFALSGFLVTASAAHHQVGRFARNRVLRIMPALAASVTFTALVIGPAVTTLPLRQYFGSPEFVRYFLNIGGHVVLTLPGVFEHLPDAGNVNISLWTVRWEILCYVIVAAGIALGVRRLPRAANAWSLAIIALPALACLTVLALGPRDVPLLADVLRPHESYFVEPLPLLDELSRAPEWFVTTVASWNFRIVPFFFAGSLAYRWRRRLPVSALLAAAMALVLAALTAAVPEDWNGPFLYLACIGPVTYLVAWVGLVRFRPVPLLEGGDYSYGIYLYGYPLQQLVHFTGLDRSSWILNIVLTLPLAFATAMLSWHLIERPLGRLGSRAARRFDGPAAVRVQMKRGDDPNRAKGNA
ncbi:MAG: acyltransferase family protein [Tsuneonella sp.]